jgi:hypothetical protein
VPYLLIADNETHRCRTWDQLVERLVWARQNDYTTAKARRTIWESDWPLIRRKPAAPGHASRCLHWRTFRFGSGPAEMGDAWLEQATSYL